MSEYHCNVEKNIRPVKEERKVSFNEPEKRTELNEVSPDRVSSNESFLEKLFKVKNLNFLLLTVLIYVMLNNKDFISLFKNIFPFLFNAANEISILGNGFIGLLFGIILIMYISFYMEDQ
jgi:hypothetical protein